MTQKTTKKIIAVLSVIFSLGGCASMVSLSQSTKEPAPNESVLKDAVMYAKQSTERPINVIHVHREDIKMPPMGVVSSKSVCLIQTDKKRGWEALMHVAKNEEDRIWLLRFAFLHEVGHCWQSHINLNEGLGSCSALKTREIHSDLFALLELKRRESKETYENIKGLTENMRRSFGVYEVSRDSSKYMSYLKDLTSKSSEQSAILAKQVMTKVC